MSSDQPCALSDPVTETLTRALLEGTTEPIDRFFDENGVAAPVIRWSPAAGEVPDGRLEFLRGFWHGSLAGAAMPSSAAIDPMTLRPALGKLLICEPVDDGEDFQIRLYGSQMALNMGRDLTGQRVSGFQPGSYITQFYLATYRAVWLRRLPLFTCHWPSAQAFSAEIPRLLLPFGRPDRVTRIVTATDADPRTPAEEPPWTR